MTFEKGIVLFVTLSIIVLIMCALIQFLSTDKKVFRIECKERTKDWPLHSTVMVTAKDRSSAVNKFYRQYGRGYDIHRIVEVV